MAQLCRIPDNFPWGKAGQSINFAQGRRLGDEKGTQIIRFPYAPPDQTQIAPPGAHIATKIDGVEIAAPALSSTLLHPLGPPSKPR